MAKVRYKIKPAIYVAGGGVPVAGLGVVDSPGWKSSSIISLDTSDTISQILIYHWRTGTPGTARIGIQGVAQSSNNQGWVNDGVWKAYIDVAGSTISTTAGLYAYTLTTPVFLSAGNYSVTVEGISGIFDGSNRWFMAPGMNVFSTSTLAHNGVLNTASTSVGGGSQSYAALRGSLRTYGFPYATFSGIAVSSPSQIGNKIRLATGSAAYFDVSGIECRLISTGTGTTYKIYDDTLSELASTDAPNNSNGTQQRAEFYFTSPVRFYPGRDYYVVCSGTQQSNFYTLLQQSDNSAFTAHDFQYCSRSSASGAFTVTSGRVAELGLIIEDQAPITSFINPEISILVRAGTTSRTEFLYLNTTGMAFNSAGLSASYVRPGSARVGITLVTQTISGSWTSGGFAEVDSVTMPGLYRLDVPNAIFASGVNSAAIEIFNSNTNDRFVVTYHFTQEMQLDLAQPIPNSTNVGSIGEALNAMRAQGFGKWAFDGTNLSMYAADNVTILKTLTFNSVSNPTMRS